MVSYKNSAPLSIAGAITAFLAITSTSTADRVFLTNKADATDIYPGCPVDIGFRVQYSDLAQLKWVQLQVLGADNSLMIEGLDNSTRVQWDATRTRTVTWTVPNNWPSGDYIIRAFGNASYSCQHGTRRERCDFALEDRETFHLHPLAASQGCPLPSIKPSTSSASIGTPTTTAPNTITKEGTAQPFSGNSADSYVKSSQDLLSKNLAVEKDAPSTSTTINGTSKDNDNSNGNLVQMTIDQSATQRTQDQAILKVLDDIRDYNIQKSTLALKSGDTIPMSDRMDSSAIARFIQTLDLSSSALRRSQNGGGGGGVGPGVGSIELIAALHKNSSLIVIPPVNPSSTATTPSVTTIVPFNHTEINPFGRGFIQDDQDQIQDKKSNDAGCRTTGITTATTVQGLLAAALAAVVGAMAL
ncbi:hypothetical protein BGZ96_008037 [Linnemannia gamsii]|uniref:Ser-Thr-rich glycosyl-phosphatidyl-inositol-anchored membrane family-domain-containing protein n=1 Tax=Linnemannia gamsii TaxID=64522 RepID=A0ABQ7JZM7_9FUNG|nr:hypothetical protein BGZ96_008037 [Linnemannia gamsii]